MSLLSNPSKYSKDIPSEGEDYDKCVREPSTASTISREVKSSQVNEPSVARLRPPTCALVFPSPAQMPPVRPPFLKLIGSQNSLRGVLTPQPGTGVPSKQFVPSPNIRGQVKYVYPALGRRWVGSACNIGIAKPFTSYIGINSSGCSAFPHRQQAPCAAKTGGVQAVQLRLLPAQHRRCCPDLLPLASGCGDMRSCKLRSYPLQNNCVFLTCCHI